MEKQRLERINELARKSRTPEGLTAEERAEQEKLRFEYVSALKEDLRAQLDSTVVQYPDGRRVRLSEKNGKK